MLNQRKESLKLGISWLTAAEIAIMRIAITFKNNERLVD
jgi:hypothetical protein